eukprot:8240197-Alexandrium_andersonii.AAC.1
MPAISALPELRAIIFCIENQCLITWEPHHGRPAASRAGSGHAARQVGVSVDRHTLITLLPREGVHCSGSEEQAPGHAQQRRP